MRRSSRIGMRNTGIGNDTGNCATSESDGGNAIASRDERPTDALRSAREHSVDNYVQLMTLSSVIGPRHLSPTL